MFEDFQLAALRAIRLLWPLKSPFIDVNWLTALARSLCVLATSVFTPPTSVFTSVTWVETAATCPAVCFSSVARRAAVASLRVSRCCSSCRGRPTVSASAPARSSTRRWPHSAAHRFPASWAPTSRSAPWHRPVPLLCRQFPAQRVAPDKPPNPNSNAAAITANKAPEYVLGVSSTVSSLMCCLSSFQ